jgi:hypothetical protein
MGRGQSSWEQGSTEVSVAQLAQHHTPTPGTNQGLGSLAQTRAP